MLHNLQFPITVRANFRPPSTGPPVPSLALCPPHPGSLNRRWRTSTLAWRLTLVLCLPHPRSLIWRLRTSILAWRQTPSRTWKIPFLPPPPNRNPSKFLWHTRNTTSLLRLPQALGAGRSFMSFLLGNALEFLTSGKLSHTLYNNTPCLIYITHPGPTSEAWPKIWRMRHSKDSKLLSLLQKTTIRPDLLVSLPLEGFRAMIYSMDQNPKECKM